MVICAAHEEITGKPCGQVHVNTFGVFHQFSAFFVIFRERSDEKISGSALETLLPGYVDRASGESSHEDSKEGQRLRPKY